MRQLDVYLNDSLAGILAEDDGGRGYTFRYDDAYVLRGGWPISVSLPLRREPYASSILFPFFTNMLPEGENRRVICRSLRIDENDLFGLLAAMADRDFIGAVKVRKP